MTTAKYRPGIKMNTKDDSFFYSVRLTKEHLEHAEVDGQITFRKIVGANGPFGYVNFQTRAEVEASLAKYPTSTRTTEMLETASPQTTPATKMKAKKLVSDRDVDTGDVI